ncbi:response regulator [Cellulophaga sp. E16_2]|uniref:Response regulator receiver protein n=1 Tax=Cellulophaga algicola (strain DSM 14237 / IC166 / ACAM 630) TaxID=688270 RepID=E6XCW0_CELAD|nr:MULTISPECIES: response regulator [Cellulophaga]ADV50101.1 response regulator receiver protein [Cellulophaga algicola DSM 14237]MBO0592490.1 response regulator [Cellulophaga sp. E16_2]
MRVYLADDDQDDRQFFSDALQELPINIELTTFQNGVDLMADLFSEAALPKAIFLDLKMPMMDGFECLADIKAEEKFRGIDVIIYSTSFNDWEVEKLQEMGANSYLQKPSSFNQLKTVLYQCLDTIKTNLGKAEEERLQFTVLK